MSPHENPVLEVVVATTAPPSSSSTTQEEQQPQPHPLEQIAQSGSHKLLLKQWLKEEALIVARVCRHQARLDSARSQAAHLLCCFFIFHALVLALLLSVSHGGGNNHSSCRRAWIPLFVSLSASLGLMWAVRHSMDEEHQIRRLLRREQEDQRLMRNCILQLRAKGTAFDLLKEVDVLRRAKTLRLAAANASATGADTKPFVRCSYRDLVTFFFVVASTLALGLTRFLLCAP